MMRSLYSAITGLKNHQISMDVIGNNIANVNTAGYKRERTTFATMLGQALRGASAPDPGGAYGGTNGIMVGLGSTLGSVDKVMGQGSSQYTGKATDMMIQGSGMFVLEHSGSTYYTRTGNFGFDQSGFLIDPSTGAIVQGYSNTAADGADPVYSGTLTSIGFKLGDAYMKGTAQQDTNYKLTGFSIDQSGVVTAVYSGDAGSKTRPIFRMALANFSNEAGLSPQGNNYYTESNNSGTPDVGFASEAGRGRVIPNSIEMSNVDLSQEFTDMIVTQRGFQANSRVITVSDTILQELIDLKRN